MSSKPEPMTGAEFKLHFADFVAKLKDDELVHFGNADLSFSRIKNRGPLKGPNTYFIEFNEIYQVIADD